METRTPPPHSCSSPLLSPPGLPAARDASWVACGWGTSGPSGRKLPCCCVSECIIFADVVSCPPMASGSNLWLQLLLLLLLLLLVAHNKT